jgi:multicomponent Na+:H+ antiporter subunit D
MSFLEPQILLLLSVFLPLITAALIYVLGDFPKLRNAAGFAGATLTIYAIYILQLHYSNGVVVAAQLGQVLPNIALAFQLNGFGLIYAGMAAILWLVTLIYCLGYLPINKIPRQTSFYAFFAITLGCVMGIAFSANLFTMFVFYELMTLCTYPLIANKAAGRVYLGVLIGASLLFFLPAIILVYHLTGSTDFISGGLLSERGISGSVISLLAILFALGIAKAALLPMHKWLPAAMVAPTPVSALLHAVAVVKAGVFCIAKITFFTIGAGSFAASGYELFGATNPVLFLGIATMLAASVFALAKDNLKQRLAYSTIAQLAYIVIATAILAPISLVAAGLHMVAHGVAKITLFFCAGAIATATGKKYVSEMNGVGRKLPLVCSAFFVASLSMIGLPFIAGGISKEYILDAAEAAHLGWVAWAFYASMALNAAYYLPISYRFFVAKAKVKIINKLPIAMLGAISITALLTLFYGVYYKEFLL